MPPSRVCCSLIDRGTLTIGESVSPVIDDRSTARRLFRRRGREQGCEIHNASLSGGVRATLPRYSARSAGMGSGGGGDVPEWEGMWWGVAR